MRDVSKSINKCIAQSHKEHEKLHPSEKKALTLVFYKKQFMTDTSLGFMDFGGSSLTEADVTVCIYDDLYIYVYINNKYAYNIDMTLIKNQSLLEETKKIFMNLIDDVPGLKQKELIFGC